METNRDQLIQRTLSAQQRLLTALHCAVDPTWLQLDLTMSQLKGLFLLRHKGPLTISAIASELSVGRPAASILVDHLHALGLVERNEDPTDRRRTLAALSERGEELVTQLRQDGQTLMLSWCGQLSDEDLAALARGLQALVAICEEQDKGTGD